MIQIVVPGEDLIGMRRIAEKTTAFAVVAGGPTSAVGWGAPPRICRTWDVT